MTKLNQKSLTNIISFFAVLIINSLFAQLETKVETEIVTTPEKQTKKILQKQNYSIIYPSTWLVEKGDSKSYFSITAPNDSLEDTFVENLNLTLIPMKSEMSVVAYAKFSKEFLPSKIKSFKVLEEKPAIINNKKAYYLIFSGIKDGKKLKWKQYYIIHKKNCFCLTATIEENKFDQYQEQINIMIKSFKIK